MSAKTAQQSKPTRGVSHRRQRYYPHIMKAIMQVLWNGGEVKTRIYKKTTYGYGVTMDYLTRMEEMGLVQRDDKVTPEICKACNRPINAVRKAHLTEKGLAYLRALQQADDILQQ